MQIHSVDKSIIIKECAPEYNRKVSLFFKKIYKEMGWPIWPIEGLDNPLAYFRKHSGSLLIVLHHGKIIGTCGIVPLTTEIALLKRFFIESDYRGTGIAAKLLDYAILFSKQKKFRDMYLDVRRDNDRGVRFWEKHGFLTFSPIRYESWIETYRKPELRYYFKKSL